MQGKRKKKGQPATPGKSAKRATIKGSQVSLGHESSKELLAHKQPDFKIRQNAIKNPSQTIKQPPNPEQLLKFQSENEAVKLSNEFITPKGLASQQLVSKITLDNKMQSHLDMSNYVHISNVPAAQLKQHTQK